MDLDLVKTFGQVAGIGGLALGVVLLVFREIVRKGPTGRGRTQGSVQPLTTVAVLTAVIGLAGIGAWVWAGSQGAPPAKPTVSATNGSIAIGGNVGGDVTNAPPAKAQPAKVE